VACPCRGGDYNSFFVEGAESPGHVGWDEARCSIFSARYNLDASCD